MENSQKFERLGGWLKFHLVMIGLWACFAIDDFTGLKVLVENVLGTSNFETRAIVLFLQIVGLLQFVMNSIYLYFAIVKKENSLKMMKYTFIARSIIGISLYMFASGPLRTSILYLELLIIPSLLLSYKNYAKSKRVLTNYGKEAIEDYT